MMREKIVNAVRCAFATIDCPSELLTQVTNASIQAGVAFFTTLIGIAVAQIMEDPLRAVIASSIAGGLTFFTSLSVQRGLVKKE